MNGRSHPHVIHSGDRNSSNCWRLRSQFLKSAQLLSDVWRQAAARLRISEKQVLLVSLHPLSPQLKLSLGMLKLGLSHSSLTPTLNSLLDSRHTFDKFRRLASPRQSEDF